MLASLFCVSSFWVLCTLSTTVYSSDGRVCLQCELDWVRCLGWGDLLEKGMSPHSSTLGWRIPWTEEPDVLQSMGSQRGRHDWVTFIFTFSFSDGKASACNMGKPGSIAGSERSPVEGNGNPLQYSCLENPMDWRSLVGYSPWDHKESDSTERPHFTHFQFFGL